MDTLTFDAYDPIAKMMTPRVVVNNTGGSFEQKAADGINHLQQKWELAMYKKDGADIEALDAFFSIQGGYKRFLWVPPGEIAPRKFLCSSYTRTLDHYTRVQSIVATLEEVA